MSLPSNNDNTIMHTNEMIVKIDLSRGSSPLLMNRFELRRSSPRTCRGKA
jgi:hypothetical protein